MYKKPFCVCVCVLASIFRFLYFTLSGPFHASLSLHDPLHESLFSSQPGKSVIKAEWLKFWQICREYYNKMVFADHARTCRTGRMAYFNLNASTIVDSFKL